jgi:hypothetical protein
MSAPILWIILPGMTAVILYFLRQFTRLVKLFGVLTALL